MGSVKAGTFLDMDLEQEYENFNDFVNDTEKVLSKVGIALRDTNKQFRDTEDVLAQVASKWEEYSDVERNAIKFSPANSNICYEPLELLGTP